MSDKQSIPALHSATESKPVWILRMGSGFKFSCGCGAESKRPRSTYGQAINQGERHVRVVHHTTAEIVP